MYLLDLILLLVDVIKLHLGRMELVRPSLMHKLLVVILSVPLRVNGGDASLALNWRYRAIAVVLLKELLRLVVGHGIPLHKLHRVQLLFIHGLPVLVGSHCLVWALLVH
jgi:hypothetical protein